MSESAAAAPKLPIAQLPLEDADPEMFDLLQKEMSRQWHGLELIASENFTSRAVLEVIGTALTNKYSEGLPGHRYYGGNEVIDQIENLCIKRALAAFRLNPEEWGVNVQPYSGSPANFAVFTGVLQPHDRIMGLDLPSGGHLTHGFYTAKKKISASSIYFESLPYKVDPETGIIDYDELEKTALVFRPKLLLCGASAYPRDFDYARLRKIADSIEALLMMDMAHVSGLVAAQVLADPFQYCDIVTTTTHKTLRGPRSGMIFFKRDKKLNLEDRINFAVFPSTQGGPHNNIIAGVAVQLKEVATPEFKSYAQQVVANCRAMADTLVSKGHVLATGGTDNHLILWNLRPHGITGNKYELLCDKVSITVNKNSIHGDKSALAPGGVRVGSAALTTRGFKEKDFVLVAEFLNRALELVVAVNKAAAGPKLADYETALNSETFASSILALKAEVEAFSKTFAMPGFNVADLKFKE